MQLNLAFHQVEAVEWGQQTALAERRLSVSRDALMAELQQDQRLSSVQLELVRPHESCRVLLVFDIVEPRAKLDPPGRDFPGALSPIAGVGWGTTRVLRGLGVTVLDPRDRPPGHVLDMRAAQDVSRYAGLHHLVVAPRLADGLGPDDGNQALRLASVRAAAWLARSVVVDAPDEVRELTLTSVADDLPRVAYVYQLHSHQRPTVAGEPLLYGDNCRHLLPTILHPNEVLDGAVVRSYTYLNMETYSIQNNGVILDLYDRHGRDLNFIGVVVYVANQLAEERQRATLMASNLVRYTLQADGAVFTKSGGGAPNVDMALIAERCEELGIKTALLVWETAGPNASDEDATLFNAPSLDAIVSIGASQLTLDLGPVDRLVAPNGATLTGPLTIPSNQLCGATDHLGASAFMGVRY